MDRKIQVFFFLFIYIFYFFNFKLLVIALVGNKVDLVDQEEVNYDEAVSYAKVNEY